MKHSIKRTALSTAIALGIAGFAANPRFGVGTY